MSNEAFELTTKVLKENKDLAKLKDSSYLQSPDAYRLDPQYKKMENDIQYADMERRVWNDQLMKIKAQQDWTPFLGWDDKGNLMFGPPQKASDVAEEDIRQRVMQMAGVTQNLQGQLQGLQKNYTARVQQDADGIKQVQRQKFSWQSDPKKLDDIVHVEGVRRCSD